MTISNILMTHQNCTLHSTDKVYYNPFW